MSTPQFTAGHIVQDGYEVAVFYADPSNFIIMDGRWYEFAEANIDLTQYAPFGTKAKLALARARGELL